MTDITAIIADDEPPLRQFLRSKLREIWPELRIIDEAKNGQEALHLIEQYRPHIAFLDIRMPGMTGLQVAEKASNLCRFVFVTAYDDYAVAAFERAAVDYLLKPVSKGRLQKTVTRLQKSLKTGEAVPMETLRNVVARLYHHEASRYLHHVRLQEPDGVRLIPVDEVIYFKARDKYTLVITSEGESLIRKPIKDLLEVLDPNRFWQIHRGTIVNVQYIDRVSRSLTGKGTIRLKGRRETLSVSNSYMHLFKQM